METGKLLRLLSSYISTLKNNSLKDELLLGEDFLVSEENSVSNDDTSVQSVLSEFVNTSDINSDGNLDICEQIEVLNKIEKEFGINCADFIIYASEDDNLATIADETSEIDTSNSTEEITGTEQITEENTEEIADTQETDLIKEPMPIEEFQEIQTVFNDLLANDEIVSEIIKKAYASITEGLTTNLESINEILIDKENITPEKETHLRELLEQRQEMLARRDELEEYLKENASIETIDALTKLQEAR